MTNREVYGEDSPLSVAAHVEWCDSVNWCPTESNSYDCISCEQCHQLWLDMEAETGGVK